MIDPVQATNSANSLTNQADITGLPQRIAVAIKTAAAKTGVDFSYLMHKAAQESGFDPNAKSSSSSATGLFQFTNQTWLRMVKDHGAQYGLANYADHIQIDSNGVAHASSPAWRQAILDLRKDPQTSAEMAGELDKENLTSLEANVGGKIGATDLYMAHFLGAGGASDFLNEMKVNPNAQAASVLPDAASSNPSVFYTSSGEPRTLAQIYNHFAQKFSDSTIMVASAAAPTTPLLVAHSKAGATSSYAVVASAASSGSLPSSYTTSVTGSIKANTSSSLVATMILAQINVDASNPSASLSGLHPYGQGKKTAIDILGSIG